MNESLSALDIWLDRDFFQGGAFLTHADQQKVIFGKYGTYQNVDKFLENEKPVFYLKDFYQNKYLAYLPGEILEVSKITVMEWLKTKTFAHLPFTPVTNEDSTYQKDFKLLSDSWKNGLEKVVMVSREQYEGFSSDQSIKHFFKKAFEFGVGQPYGFWNTEYGVIGSTPELLFNITQQTLKTFALAGTAKQGSEVELLKSPKDRHEHDLVIKDISEKLEPFVSDLYIHETEIEPYKNIVHLKTDIEAKVFKSVDLTRLTNTLSPTAALGGYPKDLSLKFLQTTNYGKKYPQRYFGSCFGVVSKEFVEFVVSIRNIQWEENTLFIESGGGVVPESVYEKEISEIHLKRNTIRKHYYETDIH